MPKIFRYIILSAFISIFFSVGCASLSSPQGGPKDSLPPFVVKSYPLPYATNFKDKKVVIDFNEFIKLKDQQKLFVVSPESKKNPVLTTRGKGVVVTFEDSLLPSTTYRLDFGNSITDNNEGNILPNYTFIFSTGNYIDSLMMVGQVLDARTCDTIIGGMVNFFDASVDSTFVDKGIDSTMLKSYASAIVRTDSSGYFIADILKDADYRIYAFDDKNGSKRYDVGGDRVGFLDSIYNPTRMPNFSFSYDSVKRRMIIDSLQFKFYVFPETLKKRQTLSEHNRVGRNKLEFRFNAPNAVYDSLTLSGVPNDWLKVMGNKTGDSIDMWIAPPTIEDYKAIQDTIKGSFVYQRQDSLQKNYFQKAELRFVNVVMPDKKKKKSDKAAADTVAVKEPEKNTFAFKVNASSELNPESGIGFVFDYPLRKLDSAAIILEHVIPATASPGARRSNTGNKAREGKEKLERAKFNIIGHSDREITIVAKWKEGEKYTLMIPKGTFENIAFESNDTLKSDFTILSPDKFGTIVAQTASDSTLKGDYIIELVSGFGKDAKIVKIKKGVEAGDRVVFRFLAQGKYRMRIIEDGDGNGEWSSGDLFLRRHPERVVMYINSVGSQDILSKINWEIVENVDLGKLFKRYR